MPGSDDKDQPGDQDDAALFAEAIRLLKEYKTAGLSEDLEQQLADARYKLVRFAIAHPGSVPALRLLAEVSQRLGDLEGTREYIDRAELLDPWNLEILIVSESLYEVETRNLPREPGQAPALDSEISSGTITTEKLIEKAMGAFRLGEMQRAYTLAKLAYRIEPGKGHHLLDVWTVGGAMDPQRTRREMIHLTQEEDQQPYLYLALGSIDNVLGLYDEAAGWLERGLAVESDDPFATAMLLNELAYVLIRRNERLDIALRLARQALEIFPDRRANGFIRDTLGLAYIKLGDMEKAVRNLREAVAKDPTVIPTFHLAVALLHQRQTAEAQVELKKIAASRPSLESPHVEETTILHRVQTHIGRLEDLLNLGGNDDIKDALSILDGLV